MWALRIAMRIAPGPASPATGSSGSISSVVAPQVPVLTGEVGADPVKGPGREVAGRNRGVYPAKCTIDPPTPRPEIVRSGARPWVVARDHAGLGPIEVARLRARRSPSRGRDPRTARRRRRRRSSLAGRGAAARTLPPALHPTIAIDPSRRRRRIDACLGAGRDSCVSRRWATATPKRCVLGRGRVAPLRTLRAVVRSLVPGPRAASTRLGPRHRVFRVDLGHFPGLTPFPMPMFL